MPDAPRRKPAAAKPKANRAAAKPKPKPAAAKPKPKPAAAKQVTSKPARVPKAPGTPDPARRRAVVRGALLSVLLIGVLFAFVYPTQTFLDQRGATTKAREQLDLLRAENAKLGDATKRLQSDDEIARIAREFYGLVKPGEQPFVILPAPTTTTAPPATTTAPPAPVATSAAGAAKPAP